MNFPKQYGQNKIWIIYNAWRRSAPPRRQDAGKPDPEGLRAEAAVEDEARCAVEALEALGHTPEVYAISSILDLAVRINGTEKPKLVFNLAEGFRGSSGREMNIAALFELLDLPYTGNTAKTLALAQDKILTKRLFESAGIPTPAWTVYDGHLAPDTRALCFPLIAKPSCEDASIGIFAGGVFDSPEKLEKALPGLFETYRQPVLVEEFIDGREINAAVLESGGKARVLPLSEILFDGLPSGEPRIAGYEAKWHEKSVFYTGTPAVCPACVEAALREKIEDLGIRVFTLLGGKDYGRVDFRVDRAGNPYVLEYNPNPDISPESGFVRSLRAGGLAFGDFAGVLLRNNGYE
ncbi:MAG: ATP-grasp domain-containing protein [Spirochaetales bacterium]|jgi:D-alanine-D-alanine ligase|nr:ATP-grasp domain-containing protein [Spirochaetales bacterium]